ncbi:uncharacterized protein LOC131077647 [Cryptomeria japonica]|uniref:uncharacterized protein LOC131077647 n=1 Tax=Cryptomeria japonica TaxID=3369 RepID=UPI0025AC2340|nr:uncharacterized protein LOC131077647 [Cryptomeria japonica]
MAPTNLSPARVAATDPHGATEKTPLQVCAKSVSRGMSSPDVVFLVQDFDNACDWLEKCTLIGYFVGRIPPESMLHDWVAKAWSPHGVRLNGVQSLTKGFFLFHFSNPSHVEAILSHGPWTVRSSLLVFQHWSHNFSVSDDKKLRAPVWVEFPSLPLPCWPFMQTIAQSVGKVVCLEPNHFFNACPQKRVCVEVDLSRDLKEIVDIQVGDNTFTQKVLYLNLPNTCYRYQSTNHKIRDCPLATPKLKPLVKESSSRPVDGAKKDEWTTVVRKGKTLAVSAQKTPVGSNSQPMTDPPV